MFKRSIAAIISFVFITFSVVPPSYAQSQALLSLPSPGRMVSPSSAYTPALIKGMTLDLSNPFQFDFIIDSGNTDLSQEELREESERLVKYFLASMTIPKNELWVNLSPYEDDRIIPESLSQTQLGRDLLAQDYLLKQLAASLMYPEDDLGEEFWDKIYRKAREQYGTIDIPVNTFNKVWIMPESAVIFENGQTVYVVESRLKVLLDEDYFAQSTVPDGVQRSETDDDLAANAEIIREVILPVIEEEVNTGKNFAPLRQIYHSLILAKWYKDRIKESALIDLYVDQHKTTGIDDVDGRVKEEIYQQYLEAYEQGVYSFMKEEYDVVSQKVIPRKYFSGGFSDADMAMVSEDNRERIRLSQTGDTFNVRVDLQPQTNRERPRASTMPVDELGRELFGDALQFWYIRNGTPQERIDSIRYFWLEGKRNGIPVIAEALSSSNVKVREAAYEALERLVLFSNQFELYVMRALESEDIGARHSAVYYLENFISTSSQARNAYTAFRELLREIPQSQHGAFDSLTKALEYLPEVIKYYPEQTPITVEYIPRKYRSDAAGTLFFESEENIVVRMGVYQGIVNPNEVEGADGDRAMLVSRMAQWESNGMISREYFFGEVLKSYTDINRLRLRQDIDDETISQLYTDPDATIDEIVRQLTRDMFREDAVSFIRRRLAQIPLIESQPNPEILILSGLLEQVKRSRPENSSSYRFEDLFDANVKLNVLLQDIRHPSFIRNANESQGEELQRFAEDLRRDDNFLRVFPETSGQSEEVRRQSARDALAWWLVLAETLSIQEDAEGEERQDGLNDGITEDLLSFLAPSRQADSAMISTAYRLDAQKVLADAQLSGKVQGKTAYVAVDEPALQGRRMAEMLYTTIRRNNTEDKPTVVILPTGSTPLSFYRQFLEMLRVSPLDVSRLNIFNMDEYYVGENYRDAEGRLWKDAPYSYHYFMRKNLIDALQGSGFDVNNWKILDGQAADLDAEIERFEQELSDRTAAQEGKVDIAFGGIGQNGHIAFNESIRQITDSLLVQAVSNQVLIGAQNEFSLSALDESRAFAALQAVMRIHREYREGAEFRDFLKTEIRDARAEAGLDDFTDEEYRQLFDTMSDQRLTFYVPKSWLEEGGIFKDLTLERAEILSDDTIATRSTRYVELTPSTIIANSPYFTSTADMTGKALTIGLGTFLRSHSAVIAAYGDKKEEAITGALLREATPQNAASIVAQNHSNIFFLLDPESAEGVSGRLGDSAMISMPSFHNNFHTGVLSGEQTFAMIKPDGVQYKDRIIEAFRKNGFRVSAGRRISMSRQAAEEFYAIHKDRPFFEQLVEYVSSGEVIPLFLRKEGAESIIAEARELQSLLRNELNAGIVENRLHASDGINAALTESSIIFDVYERAEDAAMLADDLLASVALKAKLAPEDHVHITNEAVDLAKLYISRSSDFTAEIDRSDPDNPRLVVRPVVEDAAMLSRLPVSFLIWRLNSSDLAVKEASINALRNKTDAKAQVIVRLYDSLLARIPDSTSRFTKYSKKDAALRNITDVIAWFTKGRDFDVVHTQEQGRFTSRIVTEKRQVKVSNNPLGGEFSSIAEALPAGAEVTDQMLTDSQRVVMPDIGAYEDRLVETYNVTYRYRIDAYSVLTQEKLEVLPSEPLSDSAMLNVPLTVHRWNLRSSSIEVRRRALKRLRESEQEGIKELVALYDRLLAAIPESTSLQRAYDSEDVALRNFPSVIDWAKTGYDFAIRHFPEQSTLIDHPDGRKEVVVERPEVLQVYRGVSLQDSAMLSDVGGIDFNSIEIKRHGNTTDFKFDFFELGPEFETEFQGFAPVIIQFTPIPSILPLLGFSDEKVTDELARFSYN